MHWIRQSLLAVLLTSAPAAAEDQTPASKYAQMERDEEQDQRTINPGQGRYLSPGAGEVAAKGSGILSISTNLSQMVYIPVNGLELWFGLPFLLLSYGSSGGIVWNHKLNDVITFNSSLRATREAANLDVSIQRGFVTRTASLGLTLSSGEHHASLSAGYGGLASASTDDVGTMEPEGHFSAGIPLRFAAQVRLFEGGALVSDNHLFISQAFNPGPLIQATELEDIALTLRFFAKKKPGWIGRTAAGDPIIYWDIGFIKKRRAISYEFMGQVSEYRPLDIRAIAVPWIGYTYNSTGRKERRHDRRKRGPK